MTRLMPSSEEPSATKRPSGELRVQNTDPVVFSRRTRSAVPVIVSHPVENLAAPARG